MSTTRVTISRTWTFAVALALSGAGATQLAGQGPSPAVREAVGALMATLEAGDEESARRFVEARLTPEYRERLGGGAVGHIRALQEATRLAHRDVGLDRMPDGSMRLVMSGSERVALRLRLDPETGRFGRLALAGDEAGGDGREQAVDDHLMALEQLLPTAEAAAEFRRERLAPALREQPDVFDPLLRAVARASQAASGVMLDAEGPWEVLRLRGGGPEVTVRVRVGDEPPFLIEELSVDSTGGPAAPPARPVAWEELDEFLEAQTEWGFSGTVLAVREGEVVHVHARRFESLDSCLPNLWTRSRDFH